MVVALLSHTRATILGIQKDGPGPDFTSIGNEKIRKENSITDTNKIGTNDREEHAHMAEYIRALTNVFGACLAYEFLAWLAPASSHVRHTSKPYMAQHNANTNGLLKGLTVPRFNTTIIRHGSAHPMHNDVCDGVAF